MPLIFCLIFLTVSCADSLPIDKSDTVSSVGGVSISVKSGSVGDNSLVLLVSNGTDHIINISDDFLLEEKIDAGWEILNVETAFPEYAPYMIEPGRTRRISVCFTGYAQLARELEKGRTYRIVKPVDHGLGDLSVEFVY